MKLDFLNEVKPKKSLIKRELLEVYTQNKDISSKKILKVLLPNMEEAFYIPKIIIPITHTYLPELKKYGIKAAFIMALLLELSKIQNSFNVFITLEKLRKFKPECKLSRKSIKNGMVILEELGLAFQTSDKNRKVISIDFQQIEMLTKQFWELVDEL